MKRLIIAILVSLSLILTPLAVSADELWVKNSGALHIQVWSDTPYTDVEVSGSIDAVNSNNIDEDMLNSFEKTGNCGMYVVGLGREPEVGKFELAAITVPNPVWLVIDADNITRWNVIESVGQGIDWVEPEIYLVKEEPRTSLKHQFFYIWNKLINSFVKNPLFINLENM